MPLGPDQKQIMWSFQRNWKECLSTSVETPAENLESNKCAKMLPIMHETWQFGLNIHDSDSV